MMSNGVRNPPFLDFFARICHTAILTVVNFPAAFASHSFLLRKVRIGHFKRTEHANIRPSADVAGCRIGATPEGSPSL